jgi:phage tail sheath gpL-like
MSGNLISQPSTTVNIIGASTTIDNTPQKVLFIGQKTSSGSAVALDLNESIGLDKTVINSLFGSDSMIANMLIEAREINKATQFDAICLDDDASGVAAVKTIAFSGTATAQGTIKASTGSRLNHQYEIPVAIGDTATIIGDALVLEISEDTRAPFTGVNTTGSVALTAVNKGTLGNYLGIEVSGLPAGITATITSTTSGSIDPDLTTVFDAIGDMRYQTIVWPYYDKDTIVRDFLDSRFNVTDDVLDGVAIIPFVGTKAECESKVSALNSRTIIYILDKSEEFENKYIAPALFEVKPVAIAKIAAIRSLRLTDGASVEQYVISRNGPLDSFGGPALASKPYFNTPVTNMPIIDANKGFKKLEIEDLKDAGGSVIGNNKTRTDIIMGEMVTTYKTDVASNPDVSFKFLNYVDTASNVREYFWNNLRARFAQSRLTEGDLVAGRDIANAELISQYIVQLYADLAGPEYVLVQGGEQALQFFKSSINISLDLSIGRATIQMTTPIVTQFREILATMQISFSTNG